MVMKRIFLYIIATGFLLAGCAEREKVESVTASIVIDESGLDPEVVRPVSYEVTLTNNLSNLSSTVNSSDGRASVPGLVPGLYSVNVKAQTKNGAFVYMLSGSTRSASFISDGDSYEIPVQSAKISSLLFKEIYINGSPGWYFRDQFYEIYNNGPETVYLDGICFAETVYANWDYSVVYQWDIPDAGKYVFVEIVWQIPGSGTDYPLAPGESASIAQWATNHTAESLGGASSIDNSGCEFEAIEKERTLWNGIVINDGPAINMQRVINAAGYDIPQWLISVYNSDIIMFKPSKPLENANFISTLNGSEAAREVLIDDIYDAVQWKGNISDGDKLHLPAALDAGFNIAGGGYHNLSFARKVSGEMEDGSPTFQDTNNSTNDFEVFDKPVHRRYNTKKPSWNTWEK